MKRILFILLLARPFLATAERMDSLCSSGLSETLLAPVLAVAQESEPLSVGVKGFVDTYHALRSGAENDWMSSRSRVRGEFTLSKGGAGAFVSANMVYNSLLKDRSGLQVREAYMWCGSDRWDLRAGRQIVTWGLY